MNKSAHLFTYLAGALVGITIALVGITNPFGALPAGSVAVVEGRPISQQDYAAQLAGLAQAKREPLSDVDRHYVLERMIEEEMLIVRGLELGLLAHNQSVRSTLVRTMLDSVIADTQAEVVDEQQLRKWFESHRHYFSQNPQLRVQRLQFDGEHAEQRVRSTKAQLALGVQWQDVIALADNSVVRLPNVLLPAQKLQQYLGAKLAATALTLREGEISAPIALNSSWYLMLVSERVEGTLPERSEIADQVLAAYKKDRDDRALRAYIDQLKKDYAIQRVDTAELGNNE